MYLVGIKREFLIEIPPPPPKNIKIEDAYFNRNYAVDSHVLLHIWIVDICVTRKYYVISILTIHSALKQTLFVFSLFSHRSTMQDGADLSVAVCRGTPAHQVCFSE